MLERKREMGTVLMSFGGLIMLIEILGMLTGTLGGPPLLYFLGGLSEGLGVVLFISAFVIRGEYEKRREML